jgi:hypothetical protein
VLRSIFVLSPTSLPLFPFPELSLSSPLTDPGALRLQHLQRVGTTQAAAGAVSDEAVVVQTGSRQIDDLCRLPRGVLHPRQQEVLRYIYI